jgi:glycosyltransferase 2 family protein
MRKRHIITGVVLLLGLVWVVRRFATDKSLQHFQTEGFWKTVAGANHFYLLLSAIFISVTYLLRSVRWQVMLRPTKNTAFKNVLEGTLIGFALVGVIGRPAELVRPYLIARKERMPVTSQLGAWALERILDSLAIVALLGASLWLWPPVIAEGTNARTLLESFRKAGMILLGMTVATAIFLLILHSCPAMARRVLQFMTQALPEKTRRHIDSIFQHFVSAMAVIGDFPNLLLALLSTAIIWLCVLGSYWGAAQSLGSPVNLINLGGLTLVMVASGLGSLAHLPAVGGGIQIATVLSLTHLFNIPLPIATSMALFVWVITYLLVLIPGLPLAAKEGVSWRNLKALPQASQ